MKNTQDSQKKINDFMSSFKKLDMKSKYIMKKNLLSENTPKNLEDKLLKSFCEGFYFGIQTVKHQTKIHLK